MNTKLIGTRSPVVAGAALAVALLAPPAVASPDDEVVEKKMIIVSADDQAVTTRTHQLFVTADVDEDGAVDSRAIEVRVENGDVTVNINGDEVTADRIEHRDGQIVILDGDGNEIEVIKIGVGGVHDLNELQGGWVLDDDVLAVRPTPKVMLGVHLGQPGPALEYHLGLKPGTSTMVTGVLKGLPAHGAGIKQYDVITRIGGRAPADPQTLLAVLAERSENDVVKLTVVQSGEPREVNVTLAEYDHEAMARATLLGDRAAAVNMPFGGARVIAPFGTKELELERFGNVDELKNIFIDEHDRIFEFAPGKGLRWHGAKEAGEGDDAEARLSELDERLESLHELLEQVLEEAKKQEE